MNNDTELTKIDFNFIDYYQLKLTEKGVKTTFKFIVEKKLGLGTYQFDKWVQREKVPGAYLVLITDIINDPNNCLPSYKSWTKT